MQSIVWFHVFSPAAIEGLKPNAFNGLYLNNPDSMHFQHELSLDVVDGISVALGVFDDSSTVPVGVNEVGDVLAGSLALLLRDQLKLNLFTQASNHSALLRQAKLGGSQRLTLARVAVRFLVSVLGTPHG